MPAMTPLLADIEAARVACRAAESAEADGTAYPNTELGSCLALVDTVQTKVALVHAQIRLLQSVEPSNSSILRFSFTQLRVLEGDEDEALELRNAAIDAEDAWSAASGQSFATTGSSTARSSAEEQRHQQQQHALHHTQPHAASGGSFTKAHKHHGLMGTLGNVTHVLGWPKASAAPPAMHLQQRLVE